MLDVLFRTIASLAQLILCAENALMGADWNFDPAPSTIELNLYLLALLPRKGLLFSLQLGQKVAWKLTAAHWAIDGASFLGLMSYPHL